MTTADAVDTPLALGLRSLEQARKLTRALADGTPEEHLLAQPIPGAHNAAWILGHVAVTDDYFLARLGGREPRLDASWNERYGMGTDPSGDPGANASRDELLEALDSTRAALLEWLRGLDGAALLAPLPDELAPFAPHLAAFMPALAWHEGLHAGQLAMIRRGQGLPRVLG